MGMVVCSVTTPKHRHYCLLVSPPPRPVLVVIKGERSARWRTPLCSLSLPSFSFSSSSYHRSPEMALIRQAKSISNYFFIFMTAPHWKVDKLWSRILKLSPSLITTKIKSGRGQSERTTGPEGRQCAVCLVKKLQINLWTGNEIQHWPRMHTSKRRFSDKRTIRKEN